MRSCPRVHKGLPNIARREFLLPGVKRLEWSHGSGFVTPGILHRYEFKLPSGKGTVVYAVDIIAHHSAAILVNYDTKTVVDIDFIREAGFTEHGKARFFDGWKVETLPCPWIGPHVAMGMISRQLQKGLV